MGALHDIAEASGVGIRVYEDKSFIRSDVRKVLDAYTRFTGIEADPYICISEGTLIAIVKRDKAETALELLRAKNIDAGIIGEVVEGDGVKLVKSSGDEMNIPISSQDSFWLLFFKTIEILCER